MQWMSAYFPTDVKNLSFDTVERRCVLVTFCFWVMAGLVYLLNSQQVLASDKSNLDAADNTQTLTFDAIRSNVSQQSATLPKTQKVAKPIASQEHETKLLHTPPVRPRIVLQVVLFEGNTAISDLELQKLSQPYLNRPLRYSDLEQLRLEITRAYTDRGYINSGAVLPDQKLQNGQLVYRVIEGRLDDIEVTGNERLKTRYVTSRLRMALDVPFNSEKLTEAFQLLLTDPVIERMDGQLQPMPDTKSTRLKLKVTPAEPWRFNITADNHGSPSVGAEQLTLAGQYLNLTGYGDTIDLTVVANPSRYSLSATYSILLSARDTKLSIDLGSSNSAVVEEPLDDIDIESYSSSFGVSLSHPLRRTLADDFRLGANLTIHTSRNRLLDRPFSFSPGEEDGESRVTALRFWQNFTRRTDTQAIALRSNFNFGIDAFGSTIHQDNRPDSDFFAWLGQAQFVRNLQNDGSQVLMRVDAQVSNDTLLPLERFALGGAASVRGYRKNQLVRDEALFASLEYRYKLRHSPTYGSWQIAPFLDFGSTQGETESETLFSAGAGLLWSKARYTADLYLAHVIEDVSTSTDDNLQDVGVHFRLSSRLY